MAFQLVAYNILSTRIQDSIVSLLNHHKLDPLTREKSIEKLPEERRIQAKILLTILSLLNALTASAEKENSTPKDSVLNAATYHIYDKIKATYVYTTPEGSTFYTSLATSLDLKEGNTPDSSELLALYKDLNEFLRKSVFINSDPLRGYIKEHPFMLKKTGLKDGVNCMEVTYENYQIKEDLILLTDKIYNLERQQLGSVKSGWMTMFRSDSFANTYKSTADRVVHTGMST